MSVNVNTIKRLLSILIGVLILSYLVSLNRENSFFVLNTKWLSNEFLFAIAGGAFASLIVVLVCEVIKYRQLKFATEAALFSNLANLYGQFAMMFADYINGTDYTLFYQKNKIKDILLQYKANKYQTMKSVLFGFINLQIAIQTDKIELIKQGVCNNVTSDCSYVNKTLNKVINQTTTILTYLDQVISQIDNELGNRYHWQNIKQSLNTYQDNFTEQDLDDYLKEDVIVF